MDHIVGLVPADEAAWAPCIGQVEDFASKRCTLIPVDADVQRSLAAISTTFGVDTSALDMLPIIRYLPGAPPVGVHGDVGADGLVPNRTLVAYLTDADAPGSGETFFPALNVSVAPARGAVLAFDNTDAAGAPDPAMRHGVTAVAAAATRDRLVIQIPILAGKAYAEHVSGSKHVIHMGLMASVAAGFGVWKLYQYDETFGMAAGAAVILGALALVWWKMRQAPATAHADAVDCCADEAAVCGRLAQHMKHDDAVEMEAGGWRHRPPGERDQLRRLQEEPGGRARRRRRRQGIFHRDEGGHGQAPEQGGGARRQRRRDPRRDRRARRRARQVHDRVSGEYSGVCWWCGKS